MNKQQGGAWPFELDHFEHWAYWESLFTKDECETIISCLLYTSPSPRDYAASRMPSSA